MREWKKIRRKREGGGNICDVSFQKVIHHLPHPLAVFFFCSHLFAPSPRSECLEQVNKLNEMKSAENHFCIFILTFLRFTVINLFVPFSSDCLQFVLLDFSSQEIRGPALLEEGLSSCENTGCKLQITYTSSEYQVNIF